MLDRATQLAERLVQTLRESFRCRACAIWAGEPGSAATQWLASSGHATHLDELRRAEDTFQKLFHLVPDGVVQYISKRNLYRPQDAQRLDGATTMSEPASGRSEQTDDPGQ